MTEKPVGIAMLGLGKWSRQLAKSVERTPALRLLTCYSRTAETRKLFASEFGCEEAATLEAALAHPGVEAAFIAAPSHTHLELTEACARNGIHVFVEKPMANSLDEARRMAAACTERSLVLMVGHEMRRLGSSRAMKPLIDSGEPGRIMAATAVLTLPGSFHPDNWRCHPDTNRGGALMQLGIHQLETLMYLMGPVASVQGFFTHLSAPADIFDVAACQLTFASGALANVLSTYVSPHSYEIRIFGDIANISCVADMRVWPNAVEVDANTDLRFESAGVNRPIPIAPQDVLAQQADEFARCVRGLAEPETGAREGMAALAVVEAALRSHETGLPVDPRLI